MTIEADMNSKRSFENFDINNITLNEYVSASCAVQIGLFDYLASSEAFLEEASSHFSEFEPFFRPLVYALVSTHFLVLGPDNKLSINEQVKPLVMGTTAVVLRNYDWYFLISQAPELFRQNITPSISPRTYEEFIDISEKIAQDILPLVKQDFPELRGGERRLLDVGCGKMGLSRALLADNNGLHITGIEQNGHTLEFLRGKIEAEGLQGNVEVIEGDAVETIGAVIDKEYDFVLLSHLLHWLTKEQTQCVLKSAKGLLKEGGTCIIYEDYLADNHVEPTSSVRKNLSLSIMGFQIFTEQELIEMLKENGFENIRSQIVAERRILLYCS